jgi:selenide,water dikinase
MAHANRSGGMGSNQEHFGDGVRVDAGVEAALELVLYDPQTSGGLLIAVGAGSAEEVGAQLRDAGVLAGPIGAAQAALARVHIVVK